MSRVRNFYSGRKTWKMEHGTSAGSLMRWKQTIFKNAEEKKIQIFGLLLATKHICVYLVHHAYIKFMNTFMQQQKKKKDFILNVPASREHDLHIHLSLLDCIIYATPFPYMPRISFFAQIKNSSVDI